MVWREEGYKKILVGEGGVDRGLDNRGIEKNKGRRAVKNLKETMS